MSINAALRISLSGGEQSRHLRVLGIAILSSGEQSRRAEWCLGQADGDMGRAWGFAIAFVEMPEAVRDDVIRN